MKLYALRKPIRPVLYTLLLILITTATLVFFLQTLLDGLLLDNATAEYAYVVTPYSLNAADPMKQPVSQEVLDLLGQSKNVSAMQKQSVLAAKLEDTATVPDYVMTQENLVQHYFLECEVVAVNGSMWEETFIPDSYSVNVLKNWGLGSAPMGRMEIWCRLNLEDADIIKKGDRVFLICDYYINYGYSAVFSQQCFFTGPASGEAMGLDMSSPLRKYSYALIPAELCSSENEEENLKNTEAFIRDWMEETGVLPLYEKHLQLENAATVRQITDMSLLPNAAKGQLYIAYGRQLYKSDAGKKVCLVSQGLMLRNRLSVGQTITISMADGHYTIPQDMENAGWESGFPMESEELLTYGPGEEYEIVGIYHQLGRKVDDPFCAGTNDIYIMVSETEALSQQEDRPYKLSYQVPGDKYEAFCQEVQAGLEEANYRLQVVDNGWDDVASSFYAMKDRQTLTFLCALLCFFAAGLSFGGLIYQHFRREYGLCRLLGAYQKEARRVFYGGFCLSAIPGVLISIAAAWLVYVTWLRRAVFEAAPLNMPTDLQCLGLLALGALAELLLGILFMRLLIRRSEKKGVLRML